MRLPNAQRGQEVLKFLLCYVVPRDVKTKQAEKKATP